MKLQLALAQHPMYFIIKEDTECAERTPPWGAPSTDEYARRLRRNVDSLLRHQQCSFGYEWSAYELELLAAEYPNVFEKLRTLAQSGRTEFYNGTYSQPHLQTLSSESCIRQFEYGMRVYRELCGVVPTVYAHQEASVHDQLPQLMAAFGMQFAVTPGFSSTIEFLEGGELVLRWFDGPQFVQGSEFVTWVGLDGTEVPLYLSVPNRRGEIDEIVASEQIAGLLSTPSVLVQVPDLIEVDDEWLARHDEVELVLLERALSERMAAAPPRARARFFSNWSYIEGIFAEALSRANLNAESALLELETLAALHIDAPVDLTSQWKTVLAHQHHDVYCFCAPQLKAKAVGRLNELTAETRRRAREYLASLSGSDADTGEAERDLQTITLFSSIPHPLSQPIAIDLPHSVRTVSTMDGTPIDFVQEPCGAGVRVRFVADTRGAGLRYYTAVPAETGIPSWNPMRSTLSFANEWYQVELDARGQFTSIVANGGSQLLASPGNNIHATDSTGLSPRGSALGREGMYTYPGRGPDLRFEADSSAVLHWEGGLSFRASGTVGEIAASVRVDMYTSHPRIDVAWEFNFDDSSIGTFYDDDSKLHVRFPLAERPSITHDIAFGAVSEREGRPFTPASWTDLEMSRGSLAYLHHGTPKHWVSGDTLHNLFAWGEHTEAIGSRMWRHNWMKCFDQRLTGAHRILFAILPHAGSWQDAEIAHHAQAFQRPPLTVVGPGRQGGVDAWEVVSVDPDQIVTSVRESEGSVIATAYRLTDGEIALVDRAVSVTGPDGSAHDRRVRAYEAVRMVVAPTGEQAAEAGTRSR